MSSVRDRITPEEIEATQDDLLARLEDLDRRIERVLLEAGESFLPATNAAVEN